MYLDASSYKMNIANAFDASTYELRLSKMLQDA